MGKQVTKQKNDTARGWGGGGGVNSQVRAIITVKHTCVQCCGSRSGFRCFFDPCLRDGKNPDLRSGINIPDHSSESLVLIFGVKNFYILCCGSGSGSIWTLDPGWKNPETGSGIKLRIRNIACVKWPRMTNDNFTMKPGHQLSYPIDIGIRYPYMLYQISNSSPFVAYRYRYLSTYRTYIVQRVPGTREMCTCTKKVTNNNRLI
jgi:hypothetical protein